MRALSAWSPSLPHGTCAGRLRDGERSRLEAGICPAIRSMCGPGRLWEVGTITDEGAGQKDQRLRSLKPLSGRGRVRRRCSSEPSKSLHTRFWCAVNKSEISISERLRVTSRGQNWGRPAVPGAHLSKGARASRLQGNSKVPLRRMDVSCETGARTILQYY